MGPCKLPWGREHMGPQKATVQHGCDLAPFQPIGGHLSCLPNRPPVIAALSHPTHHMQLVLNAGALVDRVRGVMEKSGVCRTSVQASMGSRVFSGTADAVVLCAGLSGPGRWFVPLPFPRVLNPSRHPGSVSFIK